jgi:site-specific recombinase XerD
MPIRLEDLLGSFRRHLRAASKAPRTVELYSQSVRSFSQWLVARDRPATLDERSRHAMSAWLAELAETCEPSTVATRLSGMHRCCRWLVTEGEVDKAPTDGIEIATAPDKPVPVLTDAEITALLKTCAVGRGRPGVFSRPIFFRRRDEAILRLPLDTGIRVSELCGLTLDDAWNASWPTSSTRAHAPEWCPSARRPARPSTATCGCVPCTRTRVPPSCCSVCVGR